MHSFFFQTFYIQMVKKKIHRFLWKYETLKFLKDFIKTPSVGSILIQLKFVNSCLFKVRFINIPICSLFSKTVSDVKAFVRMFGSS
jgi:hypothetical protein